MYRPFFITAIISFFFAISFRAGFCYFRDFTDDWLLTLIGYYYVFSLLIIAGLSLRDFKIIYSKKTVLINIILILISTPVTLVSVMIIKMPVTTFLSEESTNPRNGHTIRRTVYRYITGQVSKIEYHRFNSEDWTDHKQEFYKDSVWTSFNAHGDTVNIETYRHDSLINMIRK